MSSSRFDEARDYTFADRALALRKRAGLTQRDLASLLDVSGQSIYAWEAGLSYPGAEHLTRLIRFYLERRVLAAGREEEEAAALWATVRARAARRLMPFDPLWFASLWPAAGVSSRPPTNLPPARSTFVGRAADVVALTQALNPTTDAGTRLLTLCGVAGCGKTRLALEAAQTVQGAYPDGVWLVELASLPSNSDPDHAAVASAALAALSLREQPGRAPLDTLAARLESHRALLVLDNCEHLTAACAAFTARLLHDCPALRILCTSQRALGTADETVQHLAPLAVPPPLTTPAAAAALSVLEQYDAVRLFVTRAREVRPGYVLNAATAPGIAAICRQLDGLPLAIELAAARLHVLPEEDILARLDDRFRLLRRGGRGAIDRHHALQATMDWSYALLDPAEQAVLRRLAVFAGGWEVAAAEIVCGGDGVAADTVLELLDELLERSLVSVHEPDGAPRYGLLETVRQYGAQQLERAGELAALRDRHLSWCVGLAEQAAPALLGPNQIAWLARLDREHDNMRAALQWAVERGQATSGLRIATGLWQFWRNRGYLSEGRRWFTALLAPSADDSDADPLRLAVCANALEGAAWLAIDQHDFAASSRLFARSAALRRTLGQDERPTGPLINDAMEARSSGDYTRATALLEQSLSQHRARGNRESIMRGGLGLSLTRLALVLAEQGIYEQATALYEECRALHHDLGDREGVASSLLGLADLARDAGDASRARAYSEQCLALFREYGLKWAIGFSLNNLALAAYVDGDLAQAARHAEECESVFRTLRAWPSLAEVLVTRGRIGAALGDAVGAWSYLAEALALASEEGPRVVVAAALEALAVQSIHRGNARHGVHLLGAAALLRRQMGTPIRPCDRPAIDDALATARTTLSAADLADAWAAGHTLSVAQVVARVTTGWEEDTKETAQPGPLTVTPGVLPPAQDPMRGTSADLPRGA